MSATDPETAIKALLTEVARCNACAAHLPLDPRPILQLSATASILIASQAPGTKAHASGVPFSDASGEHLRKWMAVSEDEFYDAGRIAIIPMALCYPGRAAGGGDAAPRPECAALWRSRLLKHLPGSHLTLLVGTYAQEYVLGSGTMTDRVRNFERYLPDYFPLPHPSWRSRSWMTKNPWFEQRVLPRLREQVRFRLAATRDAV